MRIAYVCTDPGVPVFGSKGCSVHVQEVIAALIANGAEIELFTVRTGGEPGAELRNGKIHILPVQQGTGLAGRERATFAANGHLWSALEREGPFDMVYERYSLWSFAGMEYAAEHKIPGLLEVNAPLIEEQATHRGLVNRDLAVQISKRIFASASALLGVSQAIASYLKRFPGVEGRVYVVPNGVNPDRFSETIAPSMPARAGVFTVGFVGTLKPWHGLPLLVDAFANLHLSDPATRLMIVGDGPERDRLEADLTKKGISDATCLVGAVAPTQIPGLLASMDAAVAPYPEQKEFYFSPLKVYEYMAAELPVVASKLGQLEELIEEEVNGLLCDPDDSMALADALRRLRLDPQLCKKLGQEARRMVMRDHTWNGVAQRILALAREVSPYAALIGSR